MSREVNISDVIVETTATFVTKSNKWQGTMTDLRKSLSRILGKQTPETWPGSPSALRVLLNKNLSRLRKRGITVRFTRSTDRNRTRLVQLTTKR